MLELQAPRNAEFLSAARGERDALARAMTIASRQGFVLLRRQARASGLTDATVRRLVRRRLWTPVAHGVVAVLPLSAGNTGRDAAFAAARQEHALASAAAVLVRPDHAVVARSAAILHDLPVLRIPRDVEITAYAPRTTGRKPSGVLVRAARLGVFDVTDWCGVPVTTRARTVVDVARHDRRGGIIAADAAARCSSAQKQIDAALARCAGWPGIRRAREVCALADPRSESPLESLVRLALHDARLPPPELQVVIGDEVSGRNYRVDFLWPEVRLVLEADGRVKYTDDALWLEKRREAALQRMGYRVERVFWSDLGTAWPAMERRLRLLLSA